jgi:hypothetical protein
LPAFFMTVSVPSFSSAMTDSAVPSWTAVLVMALGAKCYWRKRK